MSEYKIQAYVGLTLSEIEAIDKIAQQRGVHRSTVLREAVKDFLNRQKEV